MRKNLYDQEGGIGHRWEDKPSMSPAKALGRGVTRAPLAIKTGGLGRGEKSTS